MNPIMRASLEPGTPRQILIRKLALLSLQVLGSPGSAAYLYETGAESGFL
jgi:hypothetical protein